jgi:hypothetical protein
MVAISGPNYLIDRETTVTHYDVARPRRDGNDGGASH